MNLDLYKYIYLIGVGGIGMSGLARYFHAKGKKVYGYDAVRSDLCKNLEKEGVSIHYDEHIKSISSIIKEANYSEALIIYTPAISESNSIFQFFKEKGYPLFKRAEVLGFISKNSYTIAVAGTHGKTTTSSMLAHILRDSGFSCTAFLGGISTNYNTNLILSNEGNILIVEADEYDRSFLYLNPDIAIITSLDSDHLDIYSDYDQLVLAFKQFAGQVKNKGLLLVEENIDEKFSIPDKGAMLSYSATRKADCYADNIYIDDDKIRFDLSILEIIQEMGRQQQIKDLELSLPGSHNISNAVAAVAVGCYIGVSYDQVIQSLKTFKGVRRRYEIKINREDIVYVDDYAHHPKEIEATIDATKQMFPNRNITVVFQPHLYSRTQSLADDFASALSLATEVIMLDIYPAREEPIEGVDSQFLLSKCNLERKEYCSIDDLITLLGNKELDVLLTLGAGDIGTLAEPIKHMLN